MEQSLRSKYLEELGIPDFLYTQKNTIKEASESSIVKCLVVESTKYKSFCEEGESRILLLKMMSAIGLTINDIMCINIDKNDLKEEVNKHDCDAVLIMSDEITTYKDNQFVVHHPSSIVGRDDLKRESWEILKRVKQCLK
ncbi:MAG TPA: hypothetical protein EYG35_04780 [Gammaproteobacteria bacterium]|jgi:hypothetical protein|nr:hypothetical protein [Gammaproteobacteria bacterium]